MNMSSDFTVLPPQTAAAGSRLRVATYNIHKGVRGMGAAKRLEIHNLVLGVEALDADLVFLQEVRLHHKRDAARFDQTILGWPEKGQAEFLAPDGYNTAYRSNAFTRHGEHGNALLEAVVRHVVMAHVAHFGLVHSSRMRQAQRLAQYIARELPPDEPVLVAGYFNDWGERLDQPMAAAGLTRALASDPRAPRRPTFPSRLPVFSLDRIYMRGFRCEGTMVPRGAGWARMSDHLPYVAELELN